MARVVRKAVYGTLSNGGRAQRHPSPSFPLSETLEGDDSPSEDSTSSSNSLSSIECSPRDRGEFLRYEDSDDEEPCTRYSKISNNFVDLVSQRQHGQGQPASVNQEYGTRHMLTNGNFK